MKRILMKAAILLTLLATVFMPVSPWLSQAFANSIATDTITIRVGYVGGPFMEKVTYNWKDLDDLYGGSLATHKESYSYYNGGTNDGTGRNAVAAARGFYVEDLLAYAGIDLSSVQSFEFHTEDQSVGAFATFSKRELLDTPRYYYPNMGVDADGKQVALDGDDMEAGATRVKSMLALEDCWEWDGVEPNFSGMSSSGRFHLLFGQEYPSEARTNQAAKYVHTIDVVFAGAPVFGTETNIDLKVGSDYRVQVNVTAADTQLEQYIKDNLVWSSNNTDVVDVDMYGNLTVKKDGEAVITAKSGDASASITIKIGDGTGGTGGDGEKSDSRDKGDSASSDGSDKADEKPQKEEQEPEAVNLDVENAPVEQVSYAEENQGVYILSDAVMADIENAEWVNSILQKDSEHSNEDSALQNWREDPMDDDAEQLIMEKVEKTVAQVVLPATIVLLLLGLLTGAGRYLIRR